MGNNSTLTVYKASAGSGKTFRLAVQYITMLVNHPEEYRTILAVTFTNKATAEMKQRILSQLYGIGHSLKDSDPYFEEVKKAVSLSDKTIRDNALLALDMILQDYGNFRVETIDSFFQTVLRGLARELGIGGNLTLELDKDAAIDEAVDAFLADIRPGTPEMRNVMKFVESNIENDRSWSIDKTIKNFSYELFSEIFMENGQELRRIMTENPDAVTDYKQALVDARDSKLPPIVEKIKDLGRQIMTAVGSSYDLMERYAKPFVPKIADASMLDGPLGKTLNNCATNPEKIFTKTVIRDNPHLGTLAQDTLMPLFAKVEDNYNEYIFNKNSFDCALKYLHELSLLLSIRREIDAQSQEQGRFLLADTPQLLHQMEDGDTSFVFEKTGSFTRHLMIDEFQDTSDLQWRNLAILLKECLSTGHDCLVVGDVKQSIYRWRNSDWNILNTGIEHEFAPYSPHVEDMDTNRRSRQQIIDFNKKLFPLAVTYLDSNYNKETHKEYPQLDQAYSRVKQKCLKEDGKGYVYADILTQNIRADELIDTVCEKIARKLDQLKEAGVLPTDIAILFRWLKDIGHVAQWFAQNRPEYNMISAEAFQLDSSAAIRMIINALRWLADKTDQVALAQLAWEYATANGTYQTFDSLHAAGFENALPPAFIQQAPALCNLPLYELTEKLITILGLDSMEGQSQYLMTFQDTVCQWMSRSPGDLAQFIAEWDDKLYDTKIPAADIDGIRLISIHKSKGLEFHTVIVPFCDWPIIDATHGDRLWINPDKEPYNGMPFIPVSFCKDLGNSEFSSHYNEEVGLQTVDNLNLLYVAFTRAARNLIILSNRPVRSTGFISVNDVLQVCLSNDEFDSQNTGSEIIFETGTICSHRDPDEKEEDVKQNPFDLKPAVTELKMHTYPINAEILHSGESKRFVKNDDQGERQEEYIKTGLLMHSLFATISTEADIDPQVDQMLRDGLLESAAQAQKLKQDIHRHLQYTPRAREWFDGNYTLFNETSIIYRDGDQLNTPRPDRVMIRPDGRAIVVDFKFGHEDKKYITQVQKYMDLLRKMGYTQVEGHIWYVYTNQIHTL